MRQQVRQEELVLVALADGVTAHARVIHCALYIQDVTGMPPPPHLPRFCLCLSWSPLQTKPSSLRVARHLRRCTRVRFPPYFIFCIHQLLILLLCSSCESASPRQ